MCEVHPGRIQYEAMKLITERKKIGGKFGTPEWKEWAQKEGAYIKEKVPTLYQMLENGNCDESKLTFMLGMYNRVYSGAVKKDDADKVVGKKFADEYVQPLVDKIDKNKTDK